MSSNRYSEDEKIAAVTEYLDSGTSQRKWYAKQERPFSHRTFCAWSSKYKDKILYDLNDGEVFKSQTRQRTWRDDEGNYHSDWTKVNKEQEDAKELLRAFAEGLIEEIRPAAPRPFSNPVKEDLCTEYVISDFHMGQYSDVNEVGEEWTLDKAFDLICAWIDEAINRAPDSIQAILCDLGDFLHTDGIEPVTPRGKNILDASARFRTMVDVSVSAFDYMIERLLDKHQNVHVIVCEGNHNIDSSYWMVKAVSRKYLNEPRLTFDFSHLPYYCFEWGQTGLYYHHGHLKTMAKISSAMVSMFREVYGRMKYNFCSVGHLHHKASKDCGLMEVRQHQNLPPKDAHSARHAYSGHRGALVSVYHKKYGLKDEMTIRPEMLI